MESTPQPTQPPASDAAPPDPREQELVRLREELDKRGARVDEVVRAYAAQQNEHAAFKARIERERDRLIDLERGKVALAFLEAADELDRAIRAAGDDPSPLAQGVRLCREQMGRKMSELGIEPLQLAGKAFDPNVSEAVDLVPVDDPARDGIVLEEVQRGYTVAGKLLRPARVRVGRAAPR